MGKQDVPIGKPPASGAKIFYQSMKHKPERSNHKGKTDKALLRISRTSSLASGQDVSQSLGSSTAVTPQTIDATLLPALLVSPVGKHLNESAVQPFGKRGSGTVQTVLRLIKEVSQMFHQVPYIKVVAAGVEQIIKVSDVGCHLNPIDH